MVRLMVPKMITSVYSGAHKYLGSNIKGPLIVLLLSIVPGCISIVPSTDPIVNSISQCPKAKIKGPVSPEELARWQEGCKRVYGIGYCVSRVESFPEKQHTNVVCDRMKPNGK